MLVHPCSDPVLPSLCCNGTKQRSLHVPLSTKEPSAVMSLFRNHDPYTLCCLHPPKQGSVQLKLLQSYVEGILQRLRHRAFLKLSCTHLLFSVQRGGISAQIFNPTESFSLLKPGNKRNRFQKFPLTSFGLLLLSLSRFTGGLASDSTTAVTLSLSPWSDARFLLHSDAIAGCNSNMELPSISLVDFKSSGHHFWTLLCL